VITRGQVLPKDCFRLVKVIAQDCHVAFNMAFWSYQLDRPRIAFRQRLDVLHQRGFVHVPSFFIKEHCIVSKIFLERLLVAGHDGVKQFLRSPYKFVLRNGWFIGISTPPDG
jgi:hypothetical protein